MSIAEYKYQVNQPAVAVDKDGQKYYKVTVLQVHIDVYKKSGTSQIITEVNYVVKITEGLNCSKNLTVAESQLYPTLQAAIDANKF